MKQWQVHWFAILFSLGLTTSVGLAEEFRLLPPQGIELPSETLVKLKQETASLRQALQQQLDRSSDAQTWRADVEVFVRAAELALEQNLFYKPKDADNVTKVLQIGRRRLDSVQKGERGLALLAVGSGGKEPGRTVVGGFVSAIDGSVQPYGLVLPSSDWKPASDSQLRLDVWLHGRGDTATEVPFLLERLEKLGQYAPAGVAVLHPFGRHCNAYKFAGEVDVYESIAQVQTLLPVDRARISIRGFSMGGAGVWHLAAHHPTQWFAANPGAGFVDTVQYQGWQEKWPYDPGHWGKKLMLWYDVVPWVDNLLNTKVMAYSGELDKQRASAEIMLQATAQSPILQSRGFAIEHIIGAGMGHKIDPESAQKIDAKLAEWSAQVDAAPRRKIHFTTYTLRYSKCDWLTIEEMQEHWSPAVVDAVLEDPCTIRISTRNVNGLSIDFGSGGWPLQSGYAKFVIDDQELEGPGAITGKAFTSRWTRAEGQWEEQLSDANSLRKRPGLQGPIDDAFTAPFLFVLPSRPCRHGVVQRFVDREMEFARANWRRIMRGEDRVVMDRDLTPEQIANHNLVCFGDFEGNRYLASIQASLPVQWTDKSLVVGSESYDPASYALAMVYPNPQAPGRYVVVNSGITFRQSSNATNSRQVAMLPDWAVLDVREPSDGIYPGKVAAADFFDEQWRLKRASEPPAPR